MKLDFVTGRAGADGVGKSLLKTSSLEYGSGVPFSSYLSFGGVKFCD